MPVRYRRLVFEVEGAEQGLLTAALWERGTLGVEELDRPGAGSLVAYFQAGTDLQEVDWGRYGARLLASEEYREQDWLAAYRVRARPLPVGSRLLVDPGEPDLARARAQRPAAADAGRRLLRLPARTAFGTGGHPSTRLVVELMERLDLSGRSVLDVGAGSGILSFAALLFGAARVVGIEIDPGAALVAAQNRRLNDLYPSLLAGGVGALAATGGFDLALVNVLPQHIAAELGDLHRLLRVGGTAIFSGILTEASAEVGVSLARAGFEPRQWHADGEWSALRARVGAP